MSPHAAVTLFRADPARNMCRFYHMAVQLDLFGAWCFVREWGRIGSAGQLLTIPFATEGEARAAFDQQRRKKTRRGYVSSSG
jgi:predicted DNA-binding WGR domain protein